MRFLNAMNPDWNISLFHYRNQGADYGRILIGIQAVSYTHLDVYKRQAQHIVELRRRRDAGITFAQRVDDGAAHPQVGKGQRGLLVAQEALVLSLIHI